MQNYKIKVNNEAESKEAQELFEKLGLNVVNHVDRENGFIVAAFEATCPFDFDYWCSVENEITLSQLRDLVVLSRNDVNDATHEKNGGTMFGYLCSDGTEYTWNFSKNIWFESILCFSDSDIDPIKPKKEQGLISGADAKLAWANGETIEYFYDEWVEITQEFDLGVFCRFDKFRLKPRTITLNVEIPAPFEPSECEEFYVLSSVQPTGYIRTHSKSHALLGAWKSEDEIKQVVAALRGALKNG